LPLAKIDQIVDSIASSDIMALLDVSRAITKYGFIRKMKKKQVS
jgi:hypothetical protein